jgi:hypothetical protein
MSSVSLAYTPSCDFQSARGFGALAISGNWLEIANLPRQNFRRKLWFGVCPGSGSVSDFFVRANIECLLAGQTIATFPYEMRMFTGTGNNFASIYMGQLTTTDTDFQFAGSGPDSIVLKPRTGSLVSVLYPLKFDAAIDTVRISLSTHKDDGTSEVGYCLAVQSEIPFR